MSNILTIEFVPCPPEQNAVYQVRFRRGRTGPFITYPGLFTASPIVIALADEDPTQLYEGYIDTICNGRPGPSSYWASGRIKRVMQPAGLSFELPAGVNMTDSYFRGGAGFVQAMMDWGDDTPLQIFDGLPNGENKFPLQHSYADDTVEHNALLSFEKDTDLIELWTEAAITSVGGLNSHKALSTIGLVGGALEQISGVPASVRNLDISGNALNSNDVNGVLASLVAGGYYGGVADLADQPGGAPPVDQGAVDLQILIDRGWQVDADLPG